VGRWLAILLALIGVVMLVPSVSSAVFDFRVVKLASGGLGVIIRTMIAWYFVSGTCRRGLRAELGIILAMRMQIKYV